MPEPEAASKRLLEEHWAQAPSFFERAAREISQPRELGFRALFASVPRRLGKLAQSSIAPPAELAGARPHWSLADYARLWLVASALPHVPADDAAGWLLQLFEAGELGEQISLLRVLNVLPEPGRFVEIGLQACRHNTREVFEAMVCENPFLAAHFPALNFNQAVMKAIFMEVSVRRIEGLEARITPELSRMAAGYASERRAAGRVVPADALYLAEYRA